MLLETSTTRVLEDTVGAAYRAQRAAGFRLNRWRLNAGRFEPSARARE